MHFSRCFSPRSLIIGCSLAFSFSLARSLALFHSPLFFASFALTVEKLNPLVSCFAAAVVLAMAASGSHPALDGTLPTELVFKFASPAARQGRAEHCDFGQCPLELLWQVHALEQNRHLGRVVVRGTQRTHRKGTVQRRGQPDAAVAALIAVTDHMDLSSHPHTVLEEDTRIVVVAFIYLIQLCDQRFKRYERGVQMVHAVVNQ